MIFTRKDFRIDWYSGTGAGGQHRNKHQNCVRITHIETGIVTSCQSHRERARNFSVAFEKMAHLLVAHYHGIEQKERSPVTEIIRTYNIAENRVTDHRTGEKMSWDSFDINDVIGRS